MANSRGDRSGSSSANSTNCCGSYRQSCSRPCLAWTADPPGPQDRRSDSVAIGRRQPSVCRVRRACRCDCSTRRMISNFADAGYIIPRLTRPRSYFFKQPDFLSHLRSWMVTMSQKSSGPQVVKSVSKVLTPDKEIVPDIIAFQDRLKSKVGSSSPRSYCRFATGSKPDRRG